MKRAIPLLALLAAACAHSGPSPDLVNGKVVEDRPVAVSCVPPDYRPRPATAPATAIKSPDGPTQYDALGRYYVLMEPWSVEAEAVIEGCRGAVKP